MIKELEKSFTSLSNLSNSLKINIISEQNMVEVREYIQELDIDLKSLKHNTDKLESHNTDKEKLSMLIVDLNISLVDLLSDIENIHEVLVLVAKNYSHHLK